MKIQDPKKKAMLEARNAVMYSVPAADGGPFVPIEEAAELAKVVRSNIYHWIRLGEVRKRKWGAGRMSVYASLADLKRKVPEAFQGQPKKQPAPAQRPRKRRAA